MATRRGWAAVLARLAIVSASGNALGACGNSPSGILLEVAAPAAMEPRVDELRFVIASEEGGKFVKDPNSSVTAAVRGRDLAKDPYRLLVSDGRMAGSDARIVAAVLGFKDGTADPVAFASLPPAQFSSGDVLLHHLVLGPASGVAVGATGCVTWTGGVAVDPADRDCDGYRPPADCNDDDPGIHPGARDVCGNGIDEDCDGTADEDVDRDRDGRSSCVDCDDNDRFVFPEAPEICDGADNDCDGQCEEGLDMDGDGVTPCGSIPGTGSRCATAAGGPDCLDDDPNSGPGRPERCDGKDNDCDGTCDEDQDADADGWTDCGTFAGDHPPGIMAGVCGLPDPALVDCKPDDPQVHPFAHELCNGVDDDCDGKPLLSTPCFAMSGTGCLLGRAACDDTSRPLNFGPCDTTGAAPVAARLCAACPADAADPYRCHVERGARWLVDCDLAYLRVTGDATRPPHVELCPESAAALPAVTEVSGCTWELAGGLDQERVRAGLMRTGTTPAATLASCTGRLLVTGARDERGLADDELVLLFRAGTQPASDVGRVRIVPHAVDACPAQPLGCKITTP